MNNSPELLLLVIAAGLYTLNLGRQDYRARQAGHPNPKALPGATPAPRKACWLAATGALVLLALETWGEIQLGLYEQQSNITLLFGLYTLVAAFIEELVFRGFLVLEGRGKLRQWAGVFGASIAFAALHPFLWNWESELFTWTLTPKGWFSTAAVFMSSLWFYTLRFAPVNPQHSLIPCITAHLTKNLGVLIIKASTGFVSGWW